MAEQTLPELPYERIAMAGAEMPDDLVWYDRQMFLQLRMLYYQYKQRVIDRETASREKRKLLHDYDFNKCLDNITGMIAKKMTETEKARVEYRKNRTLENADAIILAFDGVPVTFNEEALWWAKTDFLNASVLNGKPILMQVCRWAGNKYWTAFPLS